MGGESVSRGTAESGNPEPEAPAKLPSGVLPMRAAPPRPSVNVDTGAGGGANVASPDVAAAPVAPRELPVGYLADKLDDAERMLRYAAEMGIEIDDGARVAILTARLQSGAGLSEETASKLLAALTTLAAKLRPVTAENLKASADPEQSKAVIREYTRVALVLSIFIVPFSLLTFASSAISDSIRKDTDTANALAVKLSDELGPGRVVPAPAANNAKPPPPKANEEATAPPPAIARVDGKTDVKPSDEAAGAQNATPGGSRVGASRLPRGVSEKDAIRDLQQFAATIRAIDARARQLNGFTLDTVKDPFAGNRADRETMRRLLELPADLPDLPQAATDKIGVYQDIRYFAQTIQEMVSMSYGAVGTNVLPVLYALLGACAYLLRSFQEQIKNRTFTPADGHSARFLIAAIGGFIVGLFNNFNITQGVALSPLAIAFLVGYAVDVFFSFLEGLLQAFDRSRLTARGSNGKS
jgi:hypothetical protein